MKEKNIEEYWKKAKEILHRIEQLEAEGNEVGFFVSKNIHLLIFLAKLFLNFNGFKFKIQ